jgi:hypothetical protein
MTALPERHPAAPFGLPDPPPMSSAHGADS